TEAICHCERGFGGFKPAFCSFHSIVQENVIAGLHRTGAVGPGRQLYRIRDGRLAGPCPSVSPADLTAQR
ncbi:MAG TPA: hypothetical protein VN961_01180, partial [Streptosporangiaceae bacterium]|nr:hypothetical protein [Streptosporangiaceae bacterium]